jgi:O-antigen/teichoic acid export membrane protein
MDRIKVPSLNNRYLTKLLANLTGLVITFITTAVISRSLGPQAYGDFSFLNNFFMQLIPFMTFSSSIAFFTKLSQRNNEFGIIRFYRIISFVAFILLFLVIFSVQAFELEDFLWPDQSITLVFYAAIFAILTWIGNSLIQISDALGITVSTEIIKIVQKIIGLLIILILYYCQHINIINFYYYNFFILLLLIWSFILVINRPNFNLILSWSINKTEFKKYFNEFYIYCRPLFFYSVIGLVAGLFDRWLLQIFGGSAQQGFFELSLKIGLVCFIFTNASSQLITREFSIAFSEKNLEEMKRLFRRYIPLLFSIASFLSCFISVNASEVAYFFGGSQFVSASIPIAIMAFYPIHQTYGQLSGAVFYATGKTKLYSKIGLIFMIAGLPISYFFLAPISLLGLNYGAIGIAIKFVGLQFLAVNVQLYFNSKFLKLNFTKYLLHQVGVISYLVLLSWLSKILINYLLPLESYNIIEFLLSGVLYSTSVFVSVYVYPKLFGLNKSDIVNAFHNCSQLIVNFFSGRG